jgi:hypothetical protein
VQQLELKQPPHTEQAFSSFFRPSTDLAASVLYASIQQARQSSVPGRTRLSKALSCLTRNAKDPDATDRVRDDIARHLWRYLGTLGRRGSIDDQDVIIGSDQIAAGMEERLGLSERDRNLAIRIAKEFQVWIVDDCKGVFLTHWGGISSFEGKGVKVWVRQTDEDTRQSGQDRAITNYFGKLDIEGLRRFVGAKEKG